MFEIYDNFTAFDDNRIPYTVSCERHTETANLHVGVTDAGFALKSVGNRFILHTPAFQTGVFTADFTFSYPQEIDPCIQLIFGYCKKSRTGYAMQLTYRITASEPKLSAVLVAVHNGEYTPISAMSEMTWSLPEVGYAHLTLTIGTKSVCYRIGEAEFRFAHTAVRGHFAIDRSTFIGELIFRSFSLTSEEEFETQKILQTMPFSVPLINGGDIPYTVQYSVDKVDGEYYLTVVLDGGTKSRPLCKSERRGQYVTEIDYMTAPYIGLKGSSGEILFHLAAGENCFVDPNIFWDCQKVFFGDTALPIVNRYKIENFNTEETSEFIFGYQKLECRGYQQQSGAREFRWNGHLAEQRTLRQRYV